MSKRTYRDVISWSSRTSASLSDDRYEQGALDGLVATYWSYVRVYVGDKVWAPRGHSTEGVGPGTHMTFIREGRTYRLAISKRLRGYGIARVASRFAREVVAGKLDAKRQRRAAGRTQP